MSETKVFPALLKYWRAARGMSQLDLSLAADVSARHLSFLETGRSKPSEEMVLRLAATLAIPLREQNALLVAAGFPEAFPVAEETSALDPRLQQALDRMMQQQEPYPLVVMDRHYDLVTSNEANLRLFAAILGERVQSVLAAERVNALRLTFDPEALRPAIVDWAPLARLLLLRLQREVLQNPADTGLACLLDELLAYPDVPRDWHTPDFSLPSEPIHSVRLRYGSETLSFLTTLAVFNAPQNVNLEELRIESYFPLDATTERVCAELSGDAERS